MKNPTCMLAWTLIVLALTTSQSLAQSTYEPYTFTTLAGNAGYGSTDGTGSAARFKLPSGVAVDNAGNVYVADASNHTIRKVTPAGVVTTLAGLAGSAGSADGTGGVARFNKPWAVAVDSTGNVYVADQYNSTLRKVTPAGVVTTLAGLAGSRGNADGAGSAARFGPASCSPLGCSTYGPTGVAVDSAGNVYVADSGNNTIRKVTPTGTVTTLAGNFSITNRFGSPVGGYADGTGSAARFNYPNGVAVDSAGNVYVADQYNSAIRKVTPAGVVTTLAGLADCDQSGYCLGGSADGTGSAARFWYPRGVAVDGTGNVYVADSHNSTIRKVTSAGVVTTLAGLAGSLSSADGTGSDARFNEPQGVTVDSAGNVYVADTSNDTIRKVTLAGVVTTLAGLAGGSGITDGMGSDARFNYPNGVAVDSTGTVYVADQYNSTIRKVTPAGVVTTLAGLAGSRGSADGTGSAARFGPAASCPPYGCPTYGPTGVAVDSAGNLYVADSGNSTIRKVTPEGVVTTLAGLAGSSGSADGTGSAARFNQPYGVAVDNAGNIYVADTFNNTIRKVTPAGIVTTLAGLADCTQFGYCLGGSADGTGSDARFWYPRGVAVDGTGNVYVIDTGNKTVRKVTPAGVVTTLAGIAGGRGNADGTGSAAQFNEPQGVTVDSAGNVYVADTNNQTIRKVTPAGVVTTLAGVGDIFGGSEDGTGSAARFYLPSGVAVDSVSNVYVADYGNHTIRKGHPALMILSSGPGFGFNVGQFGFNLTGPTGQSVVVEASSDLVNWLPNWTNTFAGDRIFSDPQIGGVSNRFYRARLR